MDDARFSRLIRQTAALGLSLQLMCDTQITWPSLRRCAGNTYIMVPPRNTTALEGSRVKLSCQAEAFPNNVTYEWRHDGDDDGTEEVPSPSRTTVYADGSLVFTSVDVADAGWYTCRPTNGLGLTPEARAYLNVTCKSGSQLLVSALLPSTRQNHNMFAGIPSCAGGLQIPWRVEVSRWRDSLVVSVLDLRSEGSRFEPVDRRWSRSKRGSVAVCTLGPRPALTQPSILKWSVNEYRLRLERLKAGMCDAAWCTPCT